MHNQISYLVTKLKFCLNFLVSTQNFVFELRILLETSYLNINCVFGIKISSSNSKFLIWTWNFVFSHGISNLVVLRMDTNNWNVAFFPSQVLQWTTTSSCPPWTTCTQNRCRCQQGKCTPLTSPWCSTPRTPTRPPFTLVACATRKYMTTTRPSCARAAATFGFTGKCATAACPRPNWNFCVFRGCTGLTEAAFQLLTAEVYAEWVCDKCLQSKNIPLVKFKP